MNWPSPKKIIEEIVAVQYFLESHISNAGNAAFAPLHWVSAGDRVKPLTPVDQTAEVQFESAMYGIFGDASKLLFLGEERLHSNTDLSKETKLCCLVDMIDGTDLLERGFGNWVAQSPFCDTPMQVQWSSSSRKVVALLRENKYFEGLGCGIDIAFHVAAYAKLSGAGDDRSEVDSVGIRRRGGGNNKPQAKGLRSVRPRGSHDENLPRSGDERLTCRLRECFCDACGFSEMALWWSRCDSLRKCVDSAGFRGMPAARR